LGKRSKEINSELRKLSKDQFQMEKELRKGKRTDKLANLEKKTEVSLKKIAAKANLSKEIAGLSEKAEQAALKKFNAILASDLSETKITAALIGVLHNVIKTDAAGQGGKTFNPTLKSAVDYAKDKFQYTVAPHGVFIQGRPLESNSKGAALLRGSQEVAKRVYEETLNALGTGHQSQIRALIRSREAVDKYLADNNFEGTGGGPQIPQGAIDALKKDPSLADAFNKKYGAGTASRYIS